MELINIKDLIFELKKKNIDLGKGNPYNRLRYYTKIGWIDHMVRKKDSNGVVVGHYPNHVINKIIEIETLKREGKNNEEITEYFKKRHLNNQGTKQEILEGINLLELLKNKVNINVVILLIIIIGFIFEVSNYNSLKDKLPINATKVDQNNITISERGKNTLPSGKNKIFINSKNIQNNSLVIVTFDESIEPATYYFVNQKIFEEGFNLQTNLPVKKDVNFNWIIIN